MKSPRVLVFAASTRKGSYNRRLADHLATKLSAAGAVVTQIELSGYALPLYDGDFEALQGVPVPAQQLHALMREHHGVFIASPECNANLTPLLVNTLAWVSRVQDQGGITAAFGRPVFALGSASPGALGGYRGLMALRQSLELQLGARVLPAMVSVSHAHQAFDESGAMTADLPLRMSERLVTQLLDSIAPKV